MKKGGTGIFPPFPISRVPILLLFFLAISGFARADGGAVIAQETVGDLTVTLFASPTPLRAGPADISVMLQKAATGAPVLDRDIVVSVSALDASAGAAWVPPCCSMEASSAAVPATRANAQNKLLHAADVIVPAAGPVAVAVRIDGAAPIVARMEARPPLPPAAAYWPMLALPPLAIGLFAINRRARGSRPRSPARRFENV